MKNQRSIGMDAFRIFCTMGVLGYHCIDDVLMLGGLAKILYYACSFCVPGFFLMSGYLINRHESIDIKYSEKKVLGITKKYIGWILFWTIVHVLKTGELYNVWDNIMLGIVSKGIEPVAWFLFSYSIILIFAPLMMSFKNKFPTWFFIVTSFYLIIIITGKLEFIRNRDVTIQILGTYLYAAYFLLGIMIGSVEKKLKDDKMSKKYRIGIALLGICIFSIIYYREIFIKNISTTPGANYDNWYYMVWLISIFVGFMQIRVNNNHVLGIIKTLSDNTFTVYLGHLPILLYVTSIKPLDSLKAAIICIIGLFIATQFMAEIFKRVPLLRKVV